MKQNATSTLATWLKQPGCSQAFAFSTDDKYTTVGWEGGRPDAGQPPFWVVSSGRCDLFAAYHTITTCSRFAGGGVHASADHCAKSRQHLWPKVSLMTCWIAFVIWRFTRDQSRQILTLKPPRISVPVRSRGWGIVSHGTQQGGCGPRIRVVDDGCNGAASLRSCHEPPASCRRRSSPAPRCGRSC